jgi:hypothetical protein
MDEKYLDEIRNQEKIMQELESKSDSSFVEAPPSEETTQDEEEHLPEPAVKPPTGQATLFGGEL